MKSASHSTDGIHCQGRPQAGCYESHLDDAVVEVGQPDRHPGVGVSRYQDDDALLLVYLGETMGDAGEAQLEVGADDNLWRVLLSGDESAREPVKCFKKQLKDAQLHLELATRCVQAARGDSGRQ
jgi:hypothetical protein